MADCQSVGLESGRRAAWQILHRKHFCKPDIRQQGSADHPRRNGDFLGSDRGGRIQSSILITTLVRSRQVENNDMDTRRIRKYSFTILVAPIRERISLLRCRSHHSRVSISEAEVGVCKPARTDNPVMPDVTSLVSLSGLLARVSHTPTRSRRGVEERDVDEQDVVHRELTLMLSLDSAGGTS